MAATTKRTARPRSGQARTKKQQPAAEPQPAPVPQPQPDHREGVVARSIEHYTAQVPSDAFLWAAVGSIGVSLALRVAGNKHDALFVGQWAPTFLLLGLYRKLGKGAGSEALPNQSRAPSGGGAAAGAE